MRALWLLLLSGCTAVDTWARTGVDGPTFTLDADAPEVFVETSVTTDVVFLRASQVSAEDTDADGLPDRPRDPGIDVTVTVRAEVVDGDGVVRMIEWADAPSALTEPPEDVEGRAEMSFFRPCTEASTPCTQRRRHSFDLRDGGPVTLAVEVVVTGLASEESAPWISSDTAHQVTVR